MPFWLPAQAASYWRQPLRPVLSSKQLVEYVVLDIEDIGVHGSRMEGADVTVARASDFGANDAISFTRSHLGHVLHAGRCFKMALGHQEQILLVFGVLLNDKCVRVLLWEAL